MRKLFLIGVYILIVFSFIFCSFKPTLAESIDNTLVIYTIENEDQMKEVRILDTIIGQFSNNYTLVQDINFNKENRNNYNKVIYLGSGKGELPLQVKSFIDEFAGSVLSIGHNITQFDNRFSWLSIDGETLIDHIDINENNPLIKLPENRIVYNINKKDSNVLLLGHRDKQTEIPLLVEQNGDYYYGVQSLFSPFGEALTKPFQEFFNKKSEGFIRYLRLEDIHPRVDAAQLKKQAEFLKEKDIPYMVAVIPVYTNGGETVHLSDSPELVKTLKYMQKNGASIVLHGYKHQYRSSETGEGFEFWDIETDRPIYQSQNEESKIISGFSTEEEYSSFLEQGTHFEKSYIENAISKGVEELVAHGLYPLAFEAPHYAMSQQGYQILSDHFTSYVGQLQLTDMTWESEYVPIFKSQARFLHGMTVYPETVGYIEQGNNDAISEMQKKIETVQQYDQAYVSAFYHPYLGLNGLKEVVRSLEIVDDATWLDLKTEHNIVKINDINIESKNGEIKVTKPFLASKYEKNVKIKASLIYIIPSILLLAFFIRVLIVKVRKKHSKISASH